MTGKPDTEAAEAPRVIGGRWGLSISVVVALLAAAVANIRQMGLNDSRTTKLETKIDGTTGTLKEIKDAVTTLTGSTQRELSVLQRENADIRERLARETGELRVQIAELRAEIRRPEPPR